MAMQFHGRVKDGVVVFEDAAPPDGAEVRVEIVPAAQEAPSIWDKLRKYSGTVQGLPRDMARNHDHYLHGGRKK